MKVIALALGGKADLAINWSFKIERLLIDYGSQDIQCQYYKKHYGLSPEGEAYLIGSATTPQKVEVYINHHTLSDRGFAALVDTGFGDLVEGYVIKNTLTDAQEVALIKRGFSRVILKYIEQIF